MKNKKISSPKSKKPAKSEEELVKLYVDKVIRGKVSRGHIDQRFEYTKSDKTVNKDLWIDTDFYFSVVFQSADQKYEFFKALTEKFGNKALEIEDDGQIQIVNGLILAKTLLGLDLKLETARPYPTGNLELMPFVLDNSTIETK